MVAQTIELDPLAFYDSTGHGLTFGEVVDRMVSEEVVLFGEQHDHALVHWVQLQTAKALSERGNLALGGEFFETDNQVLIDEFLAGYVEAKRFAAEAKLWVNYKTDYAPILELARDSSLRFTATNVPRRYASFVAKYGLDTLAALPQESKVFLPPLPVPFDMETPGYSEMLTMMGGGHGQGDNVENIVKAQALKDYAMAVGILQNLPESGVFFHINGDFHSADYGGIYWYLHYLRPQTKILTVKVFASDSPGFDEEWRGSGDIILRVPADFTRTH